MIRSFYALLAILSLTVFTACSEKHNPEPPVGLTGTWVKKHVETNEYDADGTENSKSGLRPVTNLVLYVFTSSSLVIRDLITYTYDYKLNGELLTLYPTNSTFNIPFSQKIIKLTGTDLILQDTRPSAQSDGYTITLFHFIRQ
ncbi:hypothetical protein [Hymenobacter amundsenii]|uniref:hypothetical protein n=1 Tax=Hymenobacter amundsenii TaxID=2006685 RepID=UPI000F834338|nr:hypothetical protein [Hymenobacter amundsenii]